MEPESVSTRWRAVLDQLARGISLEPAMADELFELQQALQEELFGPGGGERRTSVDRDDPRLRVVLDVLEALSLSDPSDPSYPWMRGGILAEVGRHLEAADDYLIAARRFREVAARGDGLAGDEDDWAGGALRQAAKSLALGGQPASAAALLGELSEEDRRDVEPLIRASAQAAALD